MNKKTGKFVAFLSAFILLFSVFASGAFITSDNVEGDIILLEVTGTEDMNEVNRMGLNVLDRYGNFALVEAGPNSIANLEERGIRVNTLPGRTRLSVKGHRFDIREGYPDFPSELMIEGYEPGEEGLYLVHMLGPVNAEWRASLESKGVDIITYAPNYAYEVRMTPEMAERVEDIYFVDWVGIYQPGFKLAQDIQPGAVSINMVDGTRIITEIQEESQLIELANDNDVYYISQYHEPQLLDEMATQIIGGGLWVYDDDDNPDTAYREYGNYGSFANQIGFDGSGVVTAVADTGLGDGTTPNAGHQDFTGRVIGGYGMNDPDYWADGHDHGTHCAGSVGGDTYHGNGVYVYNDYYAAQGSAPETDLYAVKIFSDGGQWEGGDDYYEIVDVAARNAGAYVHSNSWGAETEGAYTDSDHDFDRATRDIPMILSVAAGNAGPGARGGGYNSVGSPGNAKNILTVGANQNYPDGNPDDMAGFSSRGWTDDNRVKPDIVAPGQDIYSTQPPNDYRYMSGTSMAAPAVSGAAAVLVDWYQSTYASTPSPAIVRTLMINTAYNLPNDNGGENSPHIPNQDEGWGMVNLPPIVDPQVNFMIEDQTSAVGTGDIDEYHIEYDDGNEPLKISLTWTDPAAASGADPTLINDLNLEVISPGGSVYRGNNLVQSWSEPGESTYGTFDTNGDGWDNVNNVENVYIHANDMEAGTYTVRIIGADVPEPNQDYALVMNNAIESGGGNPGPLAPTNPDPADGATGIATDVELSVYVEHEGGDRMDISFYDASDNSLIGTDNNVASASRAYANWNGLAYETTYNWYAVADDGTQTATSATWSFTTQAATAPSITLTRPTGGEVWTAGNNEDINWDSAAGDGTIIGVDLDYSIDGGASWENIVTGTADDGVYTWLVPDVETTEAQVRATVNDDLGLSGTDTSGLFTIEGTTPPTIDLTYPLGGETWYAGTDEDITWTTTAGDGAITGIDIDYSTDGGATWTNIVIGTVDDGVFTWTVPDESTAEAQIQVTVNDDNGLSGTDTSANFEIIGTPPEPPTGLTVEHYGAGEGGEELLYSVLELSATNVAGNIEYLQYNPEDAAAYDNWYEQTAIADNELIVEMDVPSGDLDGLQTIGVLVRRTDNSGRVPELTVELWQDGMFIDTLLLEQGIEDTVGEVHYMEFQAGDLVDTSGEGLELHFSAPRTGGGPGERNVVEYGAVEWQATVLGGGGDGTEDNLLTWNASLDDPDKVTHYNIYRSEEETGPWDETTLIDTVNADGSAEYSYVDPGRGTADDILWWYVVRAVDEHDQTDGNEDAVQEPGIELSTFDIELYAGGDAGGWNFVSFNLELENTDLETILEHETYGISGNYDRLMYYDATADEWLTYVPGRDDQYNNLASWNHHMGVWIRMTVDDTLTVEGTEPTQTTITLQPGWNMVGLPSSTIGNHNLPTEVSRIGYFDAAQEYNLAYDHDPGNFAFAPGEGYWLYNDADYEVDWIVD